MITNPLLEEIYATQRRLDKKAGHDIRKYAENAHLNVLEMAKKYGFKLKYGKIKGGYLEPIRKV